MQLCGGTTLVESCQRGKIRRRSSLELNDFRHRRLRGSWHTQGAYLCHSPFNIDEWHSGGEFDAYRLRPPYG